MPSALYCGRCLSTFESNGESCPNLACGAHRPPEGWGAVLAAGDVLDRHYGIEKCLAVGGAGLTYLARELGPDGQPIPPRLAIKVLYSARATGPFLRRLSTEAQILQELAHPNIVELRGFVHRSGSEPYLVTRFEEGGSLASHVDRVGPLSAVVACSVLGQILRALQVAHLRGIIHRDLKPDNVLLTETVADGVVPRVRIADFGIAKIVGGVGDRLTRSGAFVGTPEFAAPEQFDGKNPTPATDVFAAGTLLVFLLTGKPPLSLEQRGDIEGGRDQLLALLPLKLPPIRGADEPTQAAVQEILAGMTELEPERRWTVDRVLEALAPLATDVSTFTFENPLGSIRPPDGDPPPDATPEPPASIDAPPAPPQSVQGNGIGAAEFLLADQQVTADAPLLPREPGTSEEWTLAFARPNVGPEKMPPLRSLDTDEVPPPPPDHSSEAPATQLFVPVVEDPSAPPFLPPPPVPPELGTPPEPPRPDVAPPPPVVVSPPTPPPASPRATPAPASPRSATPPPAPNRPLATPIVDLPTPQFSTPPIQPAVPPAAEAPPAISAPAAAPARSAAPLAGCFGLSLFGMGAVGAAGLVGVGLVFVVVAAMAGWFRTPVAVAPDPQPAAPVVVPAPGDRFGGPDLPRGAQERVSRVVNDQAHEIGSACGHGGDTTADLAVDVTGQVVDARLQFERPQAVDANCVSRRLQRIRLRLANPTAGVIHASFRL